MALFSKDRILAPIDFSEESFQALASTIEFAEDDSDLHVIHVLNRLEPTEPGIVWQTLDDETRKQHVEKAFYEKLDQLEHQGMQFTVLIGDPSSEIIDYAKKHQIDLIVISSHSRTGLSRFLLGSVTERVVRFAKCPVLVLHRQKA